MLNNLPTDFEQEQLYNILLDNYQSLITYPGEVIYETDLAKELYKFIEQNFNNSISVLKQNSADNSWEELRKDSNNQLTFEPCD